MIHLILSLLLVAVLLLYGTMSSIIWTLFAFGLSWLVSTFAFYLRMLTLDGRRAAVVLGTMTLSLAGLWPALAVLVFFFSSNLLAWGFTWSKQGSDPKKRGLRERREGGQVWGNGFWVVICSLALFVTGDALYMVLLFTALAVVTADTWASIVGEAVGRPTWTLYPIQEVKPGEEGGVSLAGSLAAVAGGALMATLATFWITSFYGTVFIPVFVGALFGCFVDTLLGQWNRSFSNSEASVPPGNSSWGATKNDWINGAATAAGLLFSLILIAGRGGG